MNRPLLILIVAVAAFVFGLLVATPARAQGGPCGPYDAVVGALTKNYGERLVARGLGTAGSVYEVYVGPDGNFSWVYVQPNGLACLHGAGEGWERWPLPEAKQPKEKI